MFRQGSKVKKSPRQLEHSHHVTLSAAKGLSPSVARCFATLSMTGLDLAGEEELSRSFEPCLNKIIRTSTMWILHPLLYCFPPSTPPSFPYIVSVTRNARPFGEGLDGVSKGHDVGETGGC